MNLARSSVAAFLLMMVGIVWLYLRHELFTRSVPVIVVQVLAVLLMISARLAFGRRSFHAAANPTAGGLVTSGPYRWVRHPIYAAAMYFTWAPVLYFHSPQAIAAAALVTLGGVARMLAEEKMLVGMYPEYAGYKARTARIIPFVL